MGGDFNIDLESHPERLEVWDEMQNEQKDQKDERDGDAEAKEKEMAFGYRRLTIASDLDRDPLTGIGRRMKGNPKRSLVHNLQNRANVTKKAYINITHHLGDGFHKINRYEPTFKRAEYNIDHIFANFECRNVKNRLLADKNGKLSDHALVVCEFETG